MSTLKKTPRIAAFMTALLVGINVASGQVSAINGPSGSTSVAIWFLGSGITSCCSGLTNLYYSQSVATLTNNSGDPSPTIVWSTDTPGSLQVTPNPGGLSAVLTALQPSVSKTTYDINVWATVDGVRTANLPIYIDTPTTLLYSSPVNQTSGCAGIGYPTDMGYVTAVTNSVVDLTGNFRLTRIDLNETLENQKFLQSPTTWSGFPTASSWSAASSWMTSTIFVDTLTACGPSGSVPQMVSYNTSSSTPGFNETQKFWIGSQTHYLGECVQIDKTQLNTGFPTQTLQSTPGSTPAQQATCAMGMSIVN